MIWKQLKAYFRLRNLAYSKKNEVIVYIDIEPHLKKILKENHKLLKKLSEDSKKKKRNNLKII